MKCKNKVNSFYRIELKRDNWIGWSKIYIGIPDEYTDILINDRFSMNKENLNIYYGDDKWLENALNRINLNNDILKESGAYDISIQWYDIQYSYDNKKRKWKRKWVNYIYSTLLDELKQI